MAGHRDDGSRAENKAHHPNRRPSRPNTSMYFFDDDDFSDKVGTSGDPNSPMNNRKKGMTVEGLYPVTDPWIGPEKYWGGERPSLSPDRETPQQFPESRKLQRIRNYNESNQKLYTSDGHSKCYRCNETIKKGDPVLWVRGNGSFHPTNPCKGKAC